MQNDKGLIGLVLEPRAKGRLLDLCIHYHIPITYPKLFKSKKHYFLWGLSKDGIGLIGTLAISKLPIVLHGVDELESYLESLKA